MPMTAGRSARTPGGGVAGLQRAALAPPQTTNINGRTYRGQPAQPSLQPGQSTSYAAGTEWGADGSMWTPMDGAGAGQAGAGGGGQPGGGANPYTQVQPQPWSPTPEDTQSVQPEPAAAQTFAPAQTFAHVTAPGAEDSAGAENAAFSRAHARIGQLARGSMSATSDTFNARGLGGSRSEGAAMQGVVSDAAGQNADVIANQAVERLHRDQSINDRNYAGDLGQRNADMGYAANARSQDMGYAQTTRGQNISAAADRAGSFGRLAALRRATTNRPLY